MTKKKLIISLCAFVLVAALGVVGVLAATQATANIRSTVSFTAKDAVFSYLITVEKENYADENFATLTGLGLPTERTTIGESRTEEHTNVTINTAANTITFAEKNEAKIRYIVEIVNLGSNPFILTSGDDPTPLDTNIEYSAAIESWNGTQWIPYVADTQITGATIEGNTVTEGGKARFVYTLELQDSTKDVTAQNVTFSPNITGARV